MNWQTIWRSERAVYGRRPTVETGVCECHICKEQKRVIQFEASDGEYGDIMLCKECNDKLWEASDAWEKDA